MAVVLNTVAVVLVVVMSPSLTARSPFVVMLPVAIIVPLVAILPFDPVILKLPATTSLPPRFRAFTISGSYRSSAFVIPPP